MALKGLVLDDMGLKFHSKVMMVMTMMMVTPTPASEQVSPGQPCRPGFEPVSTHICEEKRHRLFLVVVSDHLRT